MSSTIVDDDSDELVSVCDVIACIDIIIDIDDDDDHRFDVCASHRIEEQQFIATIGMNDCIHWC